MSDELAEQLYRSAAGCHDTAARARRSRCAACRAAIVINCPGGSATGRPAAPVAVAEPATALDAATQMAERQPTVVTSSDRPLGGPPPEPGLVLPKTGVLGWVAQQQADFYQALVALARCAEARTGRRSGCWAG